MLPIGIARAEAEIWQRECYLIMRACMNRSDAIMFKKMDVINCEAGIFDPDHPREALGNAVHRKAKVNCIG